MIRELLKLGASVLAAALVQFADVLQAGGAIDGALVKGILIGTVLVRVAMWVVANFGPSPEA